MVDKLFSITITESNPEEAAQIANSITQVLPEEMATVNSIYSFHTADSAIIPLAPVPKNAVRATALGATPACVIIAAPDVWAQ